MTIKDKAEKKVQIAIDKIIDLMEDYTEGTRLPYECGEVLEKLRSLESSVSCADIKNGKLI